MYVNTDRQTDRQTDRRTDPHIDSRKKQQLSQVQVDTTERRDHQREVSLGHTTTTQSSQHACELVHTLDQPGPGPNNTLRAIKMCHFLIIIITIIIKEYFLSAVRLKKLLEHFVFDYNSGVCWVNFYTFCTSKHRNEYSAIYLFSGFMTSELRHISSHKNHSLLHSHTVTLQ